MAASALCIGCDGSDMPLGDMVLPGRVDHCHGTADQTHLDPPQLAEHLFDYQAWIVKMALDRERFAIFAMTGTGKTAMQLEWARHVSAHGRVLIVAPLNICDQTPDRSSGLCVRIRICCDDDERLKEIQ